MLSLQMIPLVDMLPGGISVGQEIIITGSTHINAARFVEFCCLLQYRLYV